MNKLSAGETLGGDDAHRMFCDLNEIVDEWSAKRQFLYLDKIFQNLQSGSVIFGTAPWAAIPRGAQVLGVFGINNIPLAPLQANQYAAIPVPATSGTPNVYFYDGLSVILFYPVPIAVNISIHIKTGVQAFFDQTTDYDAPPGYKNALSASLAARSCNWMLGKQPANLLADRKSACMAVEGFDPEILNAYAYGRQGQYNPLTNAYT